MADMYKIKLVKSLNGRHDKHIATANSFGLRRIGSTTMQPDNPQTLGKLHQIRYLVEAEKISEPKKPRAEKPKDAGEIPEPKKPRAAKPKESEEISEPKKPRAAKPKKTEPESPTA